MPDSITIQPGLRRGRVDVPLSKSHLHRLLIADFLAGGTAYESPFPDAAEDILATQRCLAALAQPQNTTPILDCGESGSTLRFLLPVAMTCVPEAIFAASGRLPQRPISPFLQLLADHGVHAPQPPSFPLMLTGKLQAGRFALPGNISSQIFTGLLFALPHLADDSEIVCTTPLESRGYVDMTLDVLHTYGIHVTETESSFCIPGGQQLVSPATFSPERDWSGAAFWLTMNALGSHIDVSELNDASHQPDRAIADILRDGRRVIDVSQCPDSFPVLAVFAAARHGDMRFTHVQRLRLKESDRLAAMADVLERLGVQTQNEEDFFVVHGNGPHFRGGAIIPTFNDHRIAMAAAVAATLADAPIVIENPACVAKSYPAFFQQFSALA